MNAIKSLISNGYIPILPILIWNIIFTSKLPPAYEPRAFNSNIPLFLIIGENVFRTIIFILPIFVRFNISSKIGRRGLVIFLIGMLLYFASWILLIYAPNSVWSQSALGFAAPAYTPMIWLIGLSLMFDSYYFKLAYSKWHYIIPSFAFLCFHCTHSLFVYFRLLRS